MMMKFAIVTAAVCLWAAPALAQVPCATRDKWVDLLDRTYREHPVDFGTANGRAIIEIFVSEKGTFTILATQANGLSCIIAAGQDWSGDKPAPVKEGI